MRNKLIFPCLLQALVVSCFGQQFAYHSQSPFGIQIAKEDSSRAAQTIQFYDYDGDDDLDAILTGVDYIDNFDDWSGVHSFIEVQENTGTRYQPLFGPRIDLFEDFPYPVGYFMVSAGDLNGDGKVDFILGTEIDEVGNGKLMMLLNQGTRDTVLFEVTALDAFGLTDFVPESFFLPHLTDLDLDGDLDLMASGFNSAFAEEDGPDIPTIYYAKNTDIRQATGFVGWYPQPYGLLPIPFGELLTSGDIDHDGDIDLLGSLITLPPDSNQYLVVHLNTPEPSGRPVFLGALASPFGLPVSFGTEQLAFPELADLDGDGDLDLFVFRGNVQGQVLEYYENDLCQVVTQELPVSLCEGDAITIGDESYSIAGEYTIHLQAFNQCDSIVHLLLEVLPLPVTTLEANICEGEVYVIGQDTFSSAGAYMVYVTAANGCDSLINLTLDVLPVALTSVDESICEGELYVVGQDTFDTAGNYIIYLTAANGCDSIVGLTLGVITTVVNTVEASICDGESYVIENDTFSTEGEYSVQLSGPNSCDTLILLTLTVHIVDPTVTLAEQTLTAQQTGGTYQWKDCDTGTDIPGAVDQSYQATASGNYAVVITDDNGCTAQSECVFVMVTSTDRDPVSDAVMIYPNPSKGILSLLYPPSFKVTQFTVFNLSGQPMGEFVVETNKTVDLSSLGSGLYLVKMQVNGKAVVKKIVVAGRMK